MAIEGRQYKTKCVWQEDLLVKRVDQDCTPVLKLAADQRNSGQYDTGEWRKIGEIPTVVMYEWLNEYGINIWDFGRDPDTTKKIKSLLDTDYKLLKTSNQYWSKTSDRSGNIIIK